MYPLDDTIAAISSPPGGAARGIVRLSGPEVRACVEHVFRAEGPLPPSAFEKPTATAGAVCVSGMASPLPCDLYLWPRGRSYTGQPVAEIHTLGSPPLLTAVLRTLCQSGARMAEPGEFTLRAFLAGRIDLTQAEAVLGVIDAADPHQLDVALAQLAGGLAGPLQGLRDTLLGLLAHLEAGFDFADEDLPFITAEELEYQLNQAVETAGSLAGQAASRGETAETIRAVLVGWPNTGKSSLFNALVRRTGALVSDQAGTTRDYLTAELDLEGAKCQLIDTAGLGAQLNREVAVGDALEIIQRAAQAASAQQKRQAHVQILCLDSARPLVPWEQDELARSGDGERIVALTKVDLSQRTDFAGDALRTSSVTGEGISALRDELRQAVLTAGASGADMVAGTAARCGESLRLAAESLQRAQQIARTRRGEELVASEIRVALDELGRVVGAVYTDNVLDRIFSRFCIGK